MTAQIIDGKTYAEGLRARTHKPVHTFLPGLELPAAAAQALRRERADGRRTDAHDPRSVLGAVAVQIEQHEGGPLPRRALPPVSRPGWTVLVQGLNLHVPAADDLLAQFRFVPQARLDDLMVSWASEGGGVGPHFDSYDVFLIQVSGRRHWHIGRRGVATTGTLRDDVPLKVLADFTPEQVHRMGLEQVAQISAELDKILRGEGLTQGSVGARLAQLNKRPDQLYANTPEGRAQLLEPVGLREHTAESVAAVIRHHRVARVAAGNNGAHAGIDPAQVDAYLIARREELEAGLTPIVCVGETLAQREAGETEAVVKRQLSAVIHTLAHCVSEMVVAYEPVWAIGTGLTATPEQAQAVHAVLRAQLEAATGHGDRMRILYGGSVKADNAAELFAQPDIDGGLIGGASLKAADFAAICRAAAH